MMDWLIIIEIIHKKYKQWLNKNETRIEMNLNWAVIINEKYLASKCLKLKKIVFYIHLKKMKNLVFQVQIQLDFVNLRVIF